MNKEFDLDKKPLKVRDGIDWSTINTLDKSSEITNKTPKIYTSTPEGIVLIKQGKDNEKH